MKSFVYVAFASYIMIIGNYFSKAESSPVQPISVIEEEQAIEIVKREEPLEIISPKELACVRQALYYEARSEGKAGMLAVASVIVNRKESKRYPNTYCDVIHQRLQFSYVDQFKAIGKPLKINSDGLTGKDLAAYKIANKLAKKIVSGKFEKIFDKSVMWYATHDTRNYWTTKSKRVTQVGSHVFYASM